MVVRRRCILWIIKFVVIVMIIIINVDLVGWLDVGNIKYWLLKNLLFDFGKSVIFQLRIGETVFVLKVTGLVRCSGWILIFRKAHHTIEAIMLSLSDNSSICLVALMA